jgi:hypothetical protein
LIVDISKEYAIQQDRVLCKALVAIRKDIINSMNRGSMRYRWKAVSQSDGSEIYDTSEILDLPIGMYKVSLTVEDEVTRAIMSVQTMV